MNIDPPREFDPSEELTHFHDPEHQLFGLSERVYFYLVVTTHAIEAFSAPAFTIDRPGAILELTDKAVAQALKLRLFRLAQIEAREETEDADRQIADKGLLDSAEPAHEPGCQAPGDAIGQQEIEVLLEEYFQDLRPDRHVTVNSLR